MPRWLTAAGHLLAISDSESSEQDNPQSRILHALVATLWSMVQYFSGQTQAGLESARSALEWLPPDEEYITSSILMFLAWSYQAIGNEESSACCAATGTHRSCAVHKQYCSLALCQGMGLSGCRQTPSGGTHCAPFVTHRPEGRSGTQSILCTLAARCGVLRVERPG